MFEGLDEIPWATLSHAYGAADDVPAMLRGLAFGDLEERDQAFSGLNGSIWHQGTVYDATVAALPFLLALITEHERADQLDLLILFALIAGGQGFFQVHAGMPKSAPEWRRLLAERGTTLELELERESRFVGALRTQVEPYVPLLLSHLGHSEPMLRQSVAQALVFFPSYRDPSVKALIRALEHEDDEDVRRALQGSLRDLLAGQPT